MLLRLFRKLYFTFIWLFNNKLGAIADNSSKPKIPKDIPDYEYETLARSFLPYILDYFSKEENMKNFEAWKARQKTKTQREQT